MTLPSSLTTVTPISKFLAMLLFVTLPFVGFYLGMQYGKMSATPTLYLSNNIQGLTYPTPFQPQTIRSLAEALKNPNNVYTLNLSESGLTTLPADLDKLSNLEDLYLNMNHITTFPPHFEMLKKLKYLDLTGNPMSDSEVNRIRTALPNTNVLHIKQ